MGLCLALRHGAAARARPATAYAQRRVRASPTEREARARPCQGGSNVAVCPDPEPRARPGSDPSVRRARRDRGLCGGGARQVAGEEARARPRRARLPDQLVSGGGLSRRAYPPAALLLAGGGVGEAVVAAPPL